MSVSSLSQEPGCEGAMVLVHASTCNVAREYCSGAHNALHFTVMIYGQP